MGQDGWLEMSGCLRDQVSWHHAAVVIVHVCVCACVCVCVHEREGGRGGVSKHY